MPETSPDIKKREAPGQLQVERALVVHGLYVALHTAEQATRRIGGVLATSEQVFPAPAGELFAVTSKQRAEYAKPIFQGTFDPGDSSHGTSPGMLNAEIIEVTSSEPTEPFLATRLVVTPAEMLAVAADDTCRSFDPGSGDYVSFVENPEPAQPTS